MDCRLSLGTALKSSIYEALSSQRLSSPQLFVLPFTRLSDARHKLTATQNGVPLLRKPRWNKHAIYKCTSCSKTQTGFFVVNTLCLVLAVNASRSHASISRLTMCLWWWSRSRLNGSRIEQPTNQRNNGSCHWTPQKLRSGTWTRKKGKQGRHNCSLKTPLPFCSAEIALPASINRNSFQKFPQSLSCFLNNKHVLYRE